VLALTLARAGSSAPLLEPAAGIGALLLVVALFWDGRLLGASLWVAGGTYVGYVVGVRHGIDAAAPLVAVLLLLCGELSAWSLDERRRIRADPSLAWRRGAAVAALAFAGLVAAALVLALAAAPASHGLVWTLAGAAAAVAAAGIAISVARG
jgi:hypothetical protein